MGRSRQLKTSTQSNIPTKPGRAKQTRRRVRPTLPVLLLVLLAVILVYTQIIRPGRLSASYEQRLAAATQPLTICFEELSKTTSYQLYYAPDVSFDVKQADTATILQQTNRCRSQLQTFEKTAQSLPDLRLSGFTPAHHDAKVQQQAALDIAGQSREVLDQYAAIMTFLSEYYKHTQAFVNYTSSLSNLTGGPATPGQQRQLTGQADDLRTRAEQMQQQTAPDDFQAAKDATAAILNNTASSLTSLAEGLVTQNDAQVNTAYAELNQATNDYYRNVVNIPFNQLTTSYTTKQIADLPAKPKSLLAAPSE